ncbi:MAG TPA: maltose alpha-D-glucosyltransferase [Anaerolineales bacterium]|nr:maltose alpha-D-glucosyltransferase [Anaerolineales bacterium]
MNVPQWYKNAVFYEVYVRAFYDSNGDGHGDLIGLAQKLDYLKDLGVDCLWLMPTYPSPLKDDGYDIADYCEIHADYGTLEAFKFLLKEAHARKIRIIMDLVLNHTSDQHPWFQAARADRKSPYRDYYVWSDRDDGYLEARIIFIDTERSNWTWDPVAGQYYWHRFYSSQPDLNYDNPAVQTEILKILRFWLDLGVDGFRADAVPYLFEREGTNCENLTETHAFLKRLRRFIDENYPDRILLCEANQWPRDVRAYFGDGDEFHMAFHFPLMPRIFMSMRRGDAEAIRWILEQTPSIPGNTQWCTFLRNHDELTLEMVSEEDRQWMWAQYAPEPRMRLNQGIRRRLAPLLDNDRRKIELANSLLFTLPGSPIVYYGDEIGMGDNVWLDDRNGVRTPMQWDDSPKAGFTNARPFAPFLEGQYSPMHVNVAAQMRNPDSLYHTIRRMVAVRKEHPAFGCGDFEWADSGTNAIAGYQRTYDGETMLILNNLSGQEQIAPAPSGRAVNAFTHETAPLGTLTLQPYQYLWLVLET